MPRLLNRLARTTAVLPLLLCSACLPISAPFHLYPINSPASSEPIPCRLRLHFGWQTITITATLPNGGVFSGSFPTNITPPNRELAPEWDQVFGAGFFNAKVLERVVTRYVVMVATEATIDQADDRSLSTP